MVGLACSLFLGQRRINIRIVLGNDELGR